MNTINIDASFGGVIPLGKRGETDAAEQAKTDTEGLLSQTVYIGTDGNFYTGG